MHKKQKIPQTALHGPLWGKRKLIVMAKVQQISEITPSFAFTEFDFYKDYEESFKKSEIGRIHALLPLHEMAVRFGLVDSHPRKKASRKSYFSPEGKVALMFLKVVHGIVSAQTHGSTQRKHPLPDILRHPDQLKESSDQLQPHRRHHS